MLKKHKQTKSREKEILPLVQLAMMSRGRSRLSSGSIPLRIKLLAVYISPWSSLSKKSRKKIVEIAHKNRLRAYTWANKQQRKTRGNLRQRRTISIAFDVPLASYHCHNLVFKRLLYFIYLNTSRSFSSSRSIFQLSLWYMACMFFPRSRREKKEI